MDSMSERFRTERTRLLNDFGEDVLREKRTTLGLTQKEIAEAVGMNQSTYSRIEGGWETPKDFPTADAIAHSLHLDEGQAQKWFNLLYGVHLGDSITSSEPFQRFGLSIEVSDLSSKDYLHISAGARTQVFAKGAELLNNLVPIEERRRKELHNTRNLRLLDEKRLGISWYVDHDTDHAIMLLLDWLRGHDSVRWHDLHRNLEKLIDILYLRVINEGFDLGDARSLNTLLCYSHRFGPHALAEKSMQYSLKLWNKYPNLPSAYILRDVLHCDAFCERPQAQEVFYDFLGGVYDSNQDAASPVGSEVIPGLEVLYFSPSLWSTQKAILNNQLLPNQSGMDQSESSSVIRHVLEHLPSSDQPTLSTANYALVCLRLLEINRRTLFPLIDYETVEAMGRVSSLPVPSSFKGAGLLSGIWAGLVRRFDAIETAWMGSALEFQTTVDERWD